MQIFDAKEPVVIDFELAACTGSPPQLGAYGVAYTLFETGPRKSAGAIKQQPGQASHPIRARAELSKWKFSLCATLLVRLGVGEGKVVTRGPVVTTEPFPFDVGSGDVEFQPPKPSAPLLAVAELAAPNETVGTDPGVVAPSPTRMRANIKPRPIIGRVEGGTALTASPQ